MTLCNRLNKFYYKKGNPGNMVVRRMGVLSRILERVRDDCNGFSGVHWKPREINNATYRLCTISYIYAKFTYGVKSISGNLIELTTDGDFRAMPKVAEPSKESDYIVGIRPHARLYFSATDKDGIGLAGVGVMHPCVRQIVSMTATECTVIVDCDCTAMTTSISSFYGDGRVPTYVDCYMQCDPWGSAEYTLPNGEKEIRGSHAYPIVGLSPLRCRHCKADWTNSIGRVIPTSAYRVEGNVIYYCSLYHKRPSGLAEFGGDGMCKGAGGSPCSHFSARPTIDITTPNSAPGFDMFWSTTRYAAWYRTLVCGCSGQTYEEKGQGQSMQPVRLEWLGELPGVFAAGINTCLPSQHYIHNGNFPSYYRYLSDTAYCTITPETPTGADAALIEFDTSLMHLGRYSFMDGTFSYGNSIVMTRNAGRGLHRKTFGYSEGEDDGVQISDKILPPAKTYPEAICERKVHKKTYDSAGNKTTIVLKHSDYYWLDAGGTSRKWTGSGGPGTPAPMPYQICSSDEHVTVYGAPLHFTPLQGGNFQMSGVISGGVILGAQPYDAILFNGLFYLILEVLPCSLVGIDQFSGGEGDPPIPAGVDIVAFKDNSAKADQIVVRGEFPGNENDVITFVMQWDGEYV